MPYRDNEQCVMVGENNADSVPVVDIEEGGDADASEDRVFNGITVQLDHSYSQRLDPLTAENMNGLYKYAKDADEKIEIVNNEVATIKSSYSSIENSIQALMNRMDALNTKFNELSSRVAPPEHQSVSDIEKIRAKGPKCRINANNNKMTNMQRAPHKKPAAEEGGNNATAVPGPSRPQEQGTVTSNKYAVLDREVDLDEQDKMDTLPLGKRARDREESSTDDAPLEEPRPGRRAKKVKKKRKDCKKNSGNTGSGSIEDSMLTKNDDAGKDISSATKVNEAVFSDDSEGETTESEMQNVEEGISKDSKEENIGEYDRVRKKNIPPIRVVCFPDWAPVFEKIKRHLVYEPEVSNKNGITIFVKPFCEADHRTLTAAFLAEDAKFNTNSLPSEQPLKVVLRRIPYAIREGDIEERLKPLNCFPEKVIRMKKNKDIPLPLVLLVLSKTPDYMEFIQRRELHNFCELPTVAIEKFRGRRLPLQCFFCQRFGHGSKNCHMTPRCVVCAENHRSEDCPLPKENKNVKCANCGGPHTANYAKCPRYPKPKRRAAPDEVTTKTVATNNGHTEEFKYVPAEFTPLNSEVPKKK